MQSCRDSDGQLDRRKRTVCWTFGVEHGEPRYHVGGIGADRSPIVALVTWNVDGFAEGDARGAAFATTRLAAAASELRDLIVLAWRDSADDAIGWPAVKVAEVEAGTADPWLAMYGDD